MALAMPYHLHPLLSTLLFTSQSSLRLSIRCPAAASSGLGMLIGSTMDVHVVLYGDEISAFPPFYSMLCWRGHSMYVCVHAAGHEKVAALLTHVPLPTPLPHFGFWIMNFQFPISNISLCCTGPSISSSNLVSL